MKKLILLAAVVMMAGCAETPTPNPSPKQVAETVVEQPMTDAQKIKLLRDEAHKRGIRWSIKCDDYEDTAKRYGAFVAIAYEKGHVPGSLYIEDGAKGAWVVWGDTQANAARVLYKAIQDSPNVEAHHRPSERKPDKICPKELSGM